MTADSSEASESSGGESIRPAPSDVARHKSFLHCNVADDSLMVRRRSPGSALALSGAPSRTMRPQAALIHQDAAKPPLLRIEGGGAQLSDCAAHLVSRSAPGHLARAMRRCSGPRARYDPMFARNHRASPPADIMAAPRSIRCERGIYSSRHAGRATDKSRFDREDRSVPDAA